MEYDFFWLYPSQRRQVFYLKNASAIFFTPIMFFLMIIFREKWYAAGLHKKQHYHFILLCWETYYQKLIICIELHIG